MNSDTTSSSRPESPRRGVMRRLYDWTLTWAEHPGGTWALFVLAILESSVFPIPPDVLLVALCVGALRKSFYFAGVCAAGSILGGVIGYGIGYWGYETVGAPIVQFYDGEAVMEKVRVWYHEFGFLGILAAAVTPIPYKVFTITSGLFQFPFFEFLLASALGRSARFFAVAGLLYLLGAQVKGWIDRYFDWLAWGFLALLILGFVALKFLR